MTLLVTGAGGWIGSALVQQARAAGHGVRAASRAGTSADTDAVTVGSLGPDTDWTAALAGCSCVVHLAAQIQAGPERGADPLASFRAANVAGSLNLARQAVQAGVKRLVYVSSVKVNGEVTAAGRPFCHTDPPAPSGPYAISKAEAEAGLREVARRSGLELVVVRPPLVYGPGVKANFAALLRAVRRGVPLPLAAVTHNRRSLVALDNLVSLLLRCATHPAAAGQTFLVSDGDDLSTAELLRRMGQAMGRPARLLNLPLPLLRGGAMLLNKAEVAQRLLDNLQVDIAHTCSTLAWAPPISLDEGLRRTAAALPSA